MKNIWKWVALFMSTGGFSGFFPRLLPGIFRPGGGGGMMGRLVALVIQFLFLYYDWGIVWMIFTTAVTFSIAAWTIQLAEEYYVARWGATVRHTGELVTSDFNHTDIDEILGQLIAGFPIFILPAPVWLEILALFVVFGVFQYLDDKKPLGIKQIEDRLFALDLKVMAIITDDVVAGFMASLIGFLTIIVGNVVIDLVRSFSF